MPWNGSSSSTVQGGAKETRPLPSPWLRRVSRLLVIHKSIKPIVKPPTQKVGNGGRRVFLRHPVHVHCTVERGRNGGNQNIPKIGSVMLKNISPSEPNTRHFPLIFSSSEPPCTLCYYYCSTQKMAGNYSLPLLLLQHYIQYLLPSIHSSQSIRRRHRVCSFFCSCQEKKYGREISSSCTFPGKVEL